MNRSIAVLWIICCCVTPIVNGQSTSLLTIGSRSPNLDIQHWVSGRDSNASSIVEFEAEKIYVVEFWATWCPPCIASMPHLAQLQDKYRDREVQIVGVSDEPLAEVTEFLKRDGPGNKTFQEITSSYWLACDPDASTHHAYCEAAGLNSIPTAFLIGKSGLVEWMGHPMELDQPLAEVVAGTWDRDLFAKTYQERQQGEGIGQIMMRLLAGGEIKQARELLEELKASKDEQVRNQALLYERILRSMAPNYAKDTAGFYRDELSRALENPKLVGQFAFWLAREIELKVELHELVEETIGSIEREAASVEGATLGYLWNAAASLHYASGDIENAIAAQKKCVDSSSGFAKQRQQLLLDEMMESKVE